MPRSILYGKLKTPGVVHRASTPLPASRQSRATPLVYRDTSRFGKPACFVDGAVHVTYYLAHRERQSATFVRYLALAIEAFSQRLP
jgi:hypothetical protein